MPAVAQVGGRGRQRPLCVLAFFPLSFALLARGARCGLTQVYVSCGRGCARWCERGTLAGALVKDILESEDADEVRGDLWCVWC